MGGASRYLTFVIFVYFPGSGGLRGQLPAAGAAAVGGEGAGSGKIIASYFSEYSPASQSLCYTQGSAPREFRGRGKQLHVIHDFRAFPITYQRPGSSRGRHSLMWSRRGGVLACRKTDFPFPSAAGAPGVVRDHRGSGGSALDARGKQISGRLIFSLFPTPRCSPVRPGPPASNPLAPQSEPKQISNQDKKITKTTSSLRFLWHTRVLLLLDLIFSDLRLVIRQRTALKPAISRRVNALN